VPAVRGESFNIFNNNIYRWRRRWSGHPATTEVIRGIWWWRRYASPGSRVIGNTPPVSPPQGNNGGQGQMLLRSGAGGGGGATNAGADGTLQLDLVLEDRWSRSKYIRDHQ
jgi:hypothetical protein